MPNIKSAKKRVLTSARKCNENTLVDSRMKNSIKKLERTIKEGNKEESEKVLNVTLRNIDKDEKNNLLVVGRDGGGGCYGGAGRQDTRAGDATRRHHTHPATGG